MSDRTDDYCRTVIAVAQTLDLNDTDAEHAAVVCWTAIGGETTWAMYANDGTSTLTDAMYGRQLTDAERAVARESLNYPHDAVGNNLDSMGLLQQRPMMEWGPPAELMDAETSVTKFFLGAGSNGGLLDQPGWQTDDAWHAAWTVQQCGEADIWVYQQSAVQAQADVDRLWTTAPVEPQETDDDMKLNAIRRVEDGAIFAYAPGLWHWVTGEELPVLTGQGAMNDPTDGNAREVDVLRTVMAAGVES